MNSLELLKQAYLDQLNQIKRRKCSYKTKIKLIQGLIHRIVCLNNHPQLLQIQKIYKSSPFQTPQANVSLNIKKNYPSQEYQSTSYSFCSEHSSVIEEPYSVQEYEEKIIQKRMIKFEINEEIQALEDDLFQIEKVIETKRAFNDELSKNIQRQMKQIGDKTDKKLKEEPNLSHNRSIKQNKNLSTNHNNSYSTSTSNNITSFSYSIDLSEINTARTEYVKQKKNNQKCLADKPSTKQCILNQSSCEVSSFQKNKSKSNYLGKGFTGIFKNILK